MFSLVGSVWLGSVWSVGSGLVRSYLVCSGSV